MVSAEPVLLFMAALVVMKIDKSVLPQRMNYKSLNRSSKE